MQTKIKQLSKKQKQELLNLKKDNKSAVVRNRAQAVLTRNEGFTIEQTALALQKSKSFIKDSVLRFGKGTLAAILHTSHNHKLLPADRAKIIKILQTKCPKDFGYTTQFWTMAIFKEFISKQYKVTFKQDSSYQKLFKQAGFSFHKPKPVDFRQDPENIKKFKGALKKSYATTKLRFSW